MSSAAETTRGFVRSIAACTSLCAAVLACAPSVVNEVQRPDPAVAASATASAYPAPTDADAGDGAYEYVVRRGKTTLAVAESRGPDGAHVRQAMDRAADQFVPCLAARKSEGKALLPGGARIVLQLSEHGDVEGQRVVAGEDSSYIVVRCLLPALKLQNYGASKYNKDSRSLGLAVEAIWEP